MLHNGEISNIYWEGFPRGLVIRILPANVGDTDLIPGQGIKIPHASEQLSLCTTTIEPVLWSPGAATTNPWATAAESQAPRACALQPEKPPH